MGAEPSAPRSPPEWTIERAMQFYNIDNWGAGYFTINSEGHLTVTPYGTPGPSIDIMDVLEDAQEKGLGFPLVVRFQDVLRSRVVKLNEAFRQGIKNFGYKGEYFGVYPIKVNQMREVVEEVLDAGAPYHYGLEAGSKAELSVALALNTDPEALTICNGYKDEAYMRLALLGVKLSRKVVIVVEKLSELPLLLRIAEEMQVVPWIGIRAKLTARGTGKWARSSGDFAKFGLTIPEILQAAQILKETGKESCLRLFHFHMGSQITDIQAIKDAVKEGARIYAKLRKMGFSSLEYFDVGGGLGVDYIGTNATLPSSTNYSLEEYVSEIVYDLKTISEAEKVPEPHIVSESGRSVTAYHSCIIVNIFGSIEVGSPKIRVVANGTSSEIGQSMLREMREIVSNLTLKNARETFYDARSKKEEALQAFLLGVLGLEERAEIEALYWDLCRKIVGLFQDRKRVPEDLRVLAVEMADQYLANFSLFQSALDHWAFDQLFPIVPIHRLLETPTRPATLVDITCDSDGKIDTFIDVNGTRPTLTLHELRPGEPYYIGMFLTGAYQDIMGDMHNLFGRTNEIHVFVDDEDPEDFYLETVIRGDSVSDVLSRVQYEPKELLKRVKNVVDQKIREGHLKPKEGVALLELIEAELGSYTYLRENPAKSKGFSTGPEMVPQV